MWRLGASICVLAGALTAQVPEVGDRVDAPGTHEGADQTCATLVVDLVAHRVVARRTVATLRELLARHGATCRVVVVLEPGADRTLLADLPGLDHVVASGDEWRALAEAWGIAVEEPYVAVLDGDSRLVTVCAPEAGVEWIADVESGVVHAEVARDLRELDTLVQRARQTREWGAAIELAERLQRIVPGRLGPWAAELARTRAGDRVDRKWLDRALIALDGRPIATARLLHQALRLDATLLERRSVSDVIDVLLTRTRPGVDCSVLGFQIAVLRGDDSLATRRGFAMIEACKGMPVRLAEFAARLGRGELRGRFDEVRLTAVELALRGRPDDIDLVRIQFDILIQDVHDWVGADRVGRRIVATMRDDVRALNSFAWRLLTEKELQGNLTELGLHAARSMRACDGWRTHWRLDTLALAEFESGNVATAVDLQSEAVQKCDAGVRPRYQKRLDRYLAALRASPSGTPAPIGR